MSSNEHESSTEVLNEKYTFSIVWSPLPGLTWLFPIIGHTGIADSRGVIHDFDGPGHIARSARGRTGFGKVAKYVKVDLMKDLKSDAGSLLEREEMWDRAVAGSCAAYRQRDHNLLLENCHHHVSMALNEVEFKGFTHWGTVSLIIFLMFKSKFVSIGQFFTVYGPFVVVITLAVLLGVLKPF